MRYVVRVTTSETYGYHIEADTPQEAKELVLAGDYDPYELVDASVDDVEIISKSPDIDIITEAKK